MHTDQERDVLRKLAKRVAEIAENPVMATHRQDWIEHNSLRSKYPMMLVFPEGAWAELIPYDSLQCSGQAARTIEMALRQKIYEFEHFRDDAVVEKSWSVPKVITNTGWGIEEEWVHSSDSRGARHFDPVIKEPSDLAKLRFPEISYDEKTSLNNLETVQNLFGDMLDVSLDGIKHISYHLMNQYTALRGLEEVMLDMYDEPDMLHDAMAFLEEGHKRNLKQYLEQDLLSFNNDNTYHNSGGVSFSDELPLPDADPKRPRTQDLWASAEAQEMTQVSPEHHYEFILQYEKRLLKPFGLTGYGCCEDLSKKMDMICEIPHIRRISICPWADIDVCSERLRGDYIFSWKPNPAQMVGDFNMEVIRRGIQHTVQTAKQNGCVLEIILKDTHTVEYHSERFDQWTQLARQIIEEEFGNR